MKLIIFLLLTLNAWAVDGKVQEPPSIPANDVIDKAGPSQAFPGSGDQMMLIWPDIRTKKGKQGSLKKALNSVKIEDKLKNMKKLVKVKDKSRKVFNHRKRLGQALLDLSYRGWVPNVVLHPATSPFWSQRISFVMNEVENAMEQLNMLANLHGFLVRKENGVLILIAGSLDETDSPKVSINLQDVPVGVALKSIAQAGKLDLVLGAGVNTETVSAHLKDVYPIKALKAIAYGAGLDYFQEGGIHVVKAHKKSKIKKYRKIKKDVKKAKKKKKKDKKKSKKEAKKGK